jgi:hypothetical protein
MANHVTIRLTDLSLFGNDAAEDEPEDVFRAYIVETPQIATFTDVAQALRIVRAYKGEGKSAVLREAQIRLAEQQIPGAMVVARTGAELSPDFTSDDYQSCARAWKAAVFSLLANEIGSQLGTAWTHDAMTLVEEAEKNGFKTRNFVGAIRERLQGGLEIGPAKMSLSPGSPASAKAVSGAVRRRAAGGAPIWLFVDDLDKNFENTKSQRVHVGSFFDAARELVREVPELRIRAAVRPNVWTTIKMEFESLSKVEQYIDDVSWKEEDCRTLLARRVEGYLKRNDLWQRVRPNLPPPGEGRDKYLIAFVFDQQMQWGGTIRPAHVVIYTLSKHRPRWMIELSKGGAAIAAGRSHQRITHDDLIADLTKFGDRRIQDTVAEFRSQCAEIEELISAFSRSSEQLTTDELFRLIENKILNHVDVRIAGIPGRPKGIHVAAFLFEVGFVYGRRDYGDGKYDHFSYAERPSLLRSRANMDDGLTWEIHPVFRQALEIRDTRGKELRRRPHQERRRPR